MSTSWKWPGSRWWRIDLHTHSPASHDFKPEADRANADWPQWVKSVRDAGLDAAAITDHNTAAGIAELQEAAAGLEDAPVLFPGLELTASDGVHLLLLMDPGCTHQHIDDLLTRVEIPVEQRGHQTARSSLSVEQILEAMRGRRTDRRRPRQRAGWTAGPRRSAEACRAAESEPRCGRGQSGQGNRR